MHVAGLDKFDCSGVDCVDDGRGELLLRKCGSPRIGRRIFMLVFEALEP